MATLAKTIVATGASSGLGFELVKQLLAQPDQPYRLILGARDVRRTREALDALRYDARTHSLTVLPLELADLRATRDFAAQALARLRDGDDDAAAGGLDYLLLNAALTDPVGDGGVSAAEGKAKWCRQVVVNHFAQHYLVHLLRDKLVESKARIVVVSSGGIREVKNTDTLAHDLKEGSGAAPMTTYCQSKFVQLLGAHWWRRQLKDQVTVVACSPGMIPGTGLGRGAGITAPAGLPDAKSVPEGAQSILAAFTRDDLPEDPEQIFLTSWGEWWPKDVYGLSLDQALQDKWSPSKEELENGEEYAI